jgi:DNA-binding NtrC family response regulator
MKRTVLLIDDDPLDLKALQLMLESWDLEVQTARSGRDGMKELEKRAVDLVISDVRMPGMSGEEVVAEVRKAYEHLPVVLITGQQDVRSAVRAMKAGALDYVLKPAEEDELRLAVDRALEYGRLQKENAFFHAQMEVGGAYGERMLGRSPRMLALFDLVNRVARTDSTVLITGETGTGKELVAQTLHFRSNRAARPLVAINCASVNSNLIESELFGHERGAFTGAVAFRRGRFEEADGGTLFLDEIGETSPEFQSKLLRVLQEGVFERVGGNTPIRVDVRVIASTNRDLVREVADGRFREDLFYRLKVIPIEVPPLRERGEDIILLAGHFLRLYSERYGVKVSSFSESARRHLVAQPWRGNVRELQHAVERAVILARSDTLEPGDFTPGDATHFAGDTTLEGVLDRRTREYVLTVLERTGWRKQQAAAILGVDRVTLYRLMRRFSLGRGADSHQSVCGIDEG